MGQKWNEKRNKKNWKWLLMKQFDWNRVDGIEELAVGVLNWKSSFRNWQLWRRLFSFTQKLDSQPFLKSKYAFVSSIFSSFLPNVLILLKCIWSITKALKHWPGAKYSHSQSKSNWMRSEAIDNKKDKIKYIFSFHSFSLIFFRRCLLFVLTREGADAFQSNNEGKKS